MNLIPSKFFTTSCSASSKVSDLNAFDVALIGAGIGEQNLVPVSSILPVGIVETKDRKMPMGAVTHCVLSQIRGKGGEKLAAGIAYAFRKDGNGGYVAEGHLRGNKDVLKAELEAKMKEMSKIRNIEFGDITFVVCDMEVPADSYGCCVASLVFTDYQ